MLVHTVNSGDISPFPFTIYTTLTFNLLFYSSSSFLLTDTALIVILGSFSSNARCISYASLSLLKSVICSYIDLCILCPNSGLNMFSPTLHINMFLIEVFTASTSYAIGNSPSTTSLPPYLAFRMSMSEYLFPFFILSSVGLSNFTTKLPMLNLVFHHAMVGAFELSFATIPT